jgi:heat shock protein HslJ
MARRPAPLGIRPAGLGILFSIALVAAGCAGGATPAPTTPTALPGTSWTLGVQGGTAPAARTPPSLAFASDGTMSGFTGCQPYTATYTSSGASLTISGITLTPRSTTCAPDVATAADAFVAALGAVTGWRVETVMPTQGVKVLQPIRLLLEGATPLVFTLQ